MRKFEIVPLAGVGPIKFGMTKKDVQLLLGVPCFEKGCRKEYSLEGLFVDFDNDGCVELVEFADSDQFECTYRGFNPFKGRVDEVIKFFSQFELPEVDEGSYTYLFKNLEISLWRGNVPENDSDPEGNYFEAVAVGKKCYFS